MLLNLKSDSVEQKPDNLTLKMTEKEDFYPTRWSLTLFLRHGVDQVDRVVLEGEGSLTQRGAAANFKRRAEHLLQSCLHDAIERGIL